MGDAKRRGSFEERKEAAIKRKEAEDERQKSFQRSIIRTTRQPSNIRSYLQLASIMSLSDPIGKAFGYSLPNIQTNKRSK